MLMPSNKPASSSSPPASPTASPPDEAADYPLDVIETMFVKPGQPRQPDSAHTRCSRDGDACRARQFRERRRRGDHAGPRFAPRESVRKPMTRPSHSSGGFGGRRCARRRARSGLHSVGCSGGDMGGGVAFVGHVAGGDEQVAGVTGRSHPPPTSHRSSPSTAPEPAPAAPQASCAAAAPPTTTPPAQTPAQGHNLVPGGTGRDNDPMTP